MDWISLLKAQQADFLQRVNKPKTYDLTLLESQAKGCHRERIVFSGEQLDKIIDLSREKAEIVAKNPPPTPPEYPEEDEYWSIPFAQYFRNQAKTYLLREQIVGLVMAERLGKLVKNLPKDTVENMVLDDEGNLRGLSKFTYVLADNPQLSIQVYAVDGESVNSIKKNKVRWSVTQDDLKNYQVLLFLCLLAPFSKGDIYQKQAIIAGFLPTNQIEFIEPKLDFYPSDLLYAGGLSWYLKSLISQKAAQPLVDEKIIEKIKSFPLEHPQKIVIGDWECWQTLKGHTRGINCLALSSSSENGKTSPILASGSRGETKLWDLSKGELIETLSEYPWIVSGRVDEVNSLAFSLDGQTLVTGGADSTIKLWHLGALDLIDILHKHNGMVRCVALTPDGLMLATAGDDRKVLFWDLMQRQVAIALSLDDTAAHSLVISPDGQTLATGSYRKIKVWQISQLTKGKIIQDSQPLYTLTGHSHIVSSLAMSADGKLLVSGSWDQTIKIWHLETGKLVRTLTGHRDKVYAIALSPDKQIIASGSADQTIKLWHLETGELLATFTGHSHTVTALAFTDSGEMLVSGSLDQTIKIWQRS
ncbi:WD40 repeat domain-containing protein [Nodularia sphaerocarpa]|uniref:WD40 repeat domain-containing protein n=1 Tax=Nodularia sphaerocarpa TaxID=137816 RepID=UPI001EFB1E70|nr:WD40 repeat domain-containing protein [Nodularia sphaerocarpa]MDB9375600.1 WD40 repeat domain-containing protein [Nodularia sphaerocarpa CS-585]MDB9379796.1 WD40 repeat domain-containing protein [Nodularia sphaerocarpa CS-585A2]